MRALLVFVILAVSALAQDVEIRPIEQPDRGARLWKVSMATLAVASAVDAHSSWGKCCESNALLRSPDQRFGSRAAFIKTAALGGQLSFQAFAAKRSKKMRTLFTVLNFGTSVALSAVAAHNYGVPQPSGGLR